MILIITVRNSSYRKVLFSQVCVKNSVHGGGCTRLLDTPPDTPPGHPPPTATAADGTHPTGMHSCYYIMFS